MASVEVAKHQTWKVIEKDTSQEKDIRRAFAREVCEVLPEFMDPIGEETIHEEVSRKHVERTIEQVSQGILFACDKGWLKKYGDDNSGWTYETTTRLQLMTACKEADVSLVEEYCRDLDFSLEMPDRPEGYLSCPVVEAIDSEREWMRKNAVVDMLIKRNAKLPFSQDVGDNLFLNQEAAYAEKTKVVTYYLQEKDFDCVMLSARSKMGKLPSDVAKEYGNKVMVDFFNLVEKGVSRIFAGEVCQVLADSDNRMKFEDIFEGVRVNSAERTVEAVHQGVALGIEKGWLFGIEYEGLAKQYSLTPRMSCLLECKYGRIDEIRECQVKNMEINFSLEIPYRPDGYLSCPLIEALDSECKERLSIISVLEMMNATMPEPVDGCFLHQEAMYAKKTNVANYYLKNIDVYGKNLSAKNSRGETPYEVAMASGNDVMIQFFELRNKINAKVEQNAREVTLNILEDMQPRSLAELKSMHEGKQGIERALQYACRNSWLRLETKTEGLQRRTTGRYEITPGLKFMQACRYGDVGILSESAEGNNRFWDVRMNMPDDPSDYISSALQEALESTCEKRDEIIRILEEGGACFYWVDSNDEKFRFLSGEIKNKHARVLQYYLSKYESSENVLDLKDETEKSIGGYLDEAGCDKLRAMFDLHRNAMLSKRDCKNFEQVIVGKSVVPCRQNAKVIAVLDSGSSSNDELDESCHVDEREKHCLVSKKIDPMVWIDLLLKRDDVAFNQFLREQGYDSLRDDFGNTPMHFMCKPEYYLGYVRRCASSRIDCAHVFHMASEKVESALGICLEHGGSLHAKNDSGDTPLHLAVKTAFLPTIKLLVLWDKGGANLFAKNDEGMTPLMLAIRAENNVVVFELLQLGSCPDDILEMGLPSLEYFADAVAKFDQDSLVGSDFLERLSDKIIQIRSKQKLD
ncbi:hypothetical protein GCM10023116_01240 [Kistimonas scapharcae]|uniref:Uncharacterized protein n=1 Tax=Kistimonas scapharcae TaxID=1036133 RepID=A0ABP8UW85_9GAMM